MSYESIKIKDIVDRSVSHSWSIPEFQRGFVWKGTQVRDLMESLWLDYPIGSLLVWNSSKPTEERIVRDAQRPTLWVVDGQQRATALCILSGRKPYWWASADAWEKTLKKYDIRFDVDAKEAPYFKVADAIVRQASGDRYVPISKLLVLDTQKEKDQQTLQSLAKQIEKQGLCKDMDAMEIYTRLDRVRKIRDKDVITVTIDQDLEDVVEIFSRLNSKGTRVTEADIYLGMVAARNPGWVRDTFLPYLSKLKDAGFGLDPNLLFRTMTGIGAKKVKFREIPEAFWSKENIEPHWNKTKEAWKNLILRFREFGVLSNNPMPTEAALVTMISLTDKFPAAQFEPMLYWFLQASRFGRYSASGTTSLEEDLRDITDSTSVEVALNSLLKRLPHSTELTAEDFLVDYADSRFGRFLLYLLTYRNEATDWDLRGHRIGFQGKEFLSDFRPQWHHIFPRKYLEGEAPDEKINALANIAVIGPEINIRISAKSPMDYVERYSITKEKLEQQFIDKNITGVGIETYGDWLQNRAKVLAGAANAFLSHLKEGLNAQAKAS